MNLLILHELGHLISYFLAVAILYLFSKKYFTLKNFLVGLLATVFIDLDHVIDYLIYKGYLAFDIWEFFSGSYFAFNGKAYVIFHAWEYVLLIFLLFLDESDKKGKSWMLFIAVGLFAHLVFDTVSYGFPWEMYSIMSRVFDSFRFVQ